MVAVLTSAVYCQFLLLCEKKVLSCLKLPCVGPMDICNDFCEATTEDFKDASCGERTVTNKCNVNPKTGSQQSGSSCVGKVKEVCSKFRKLEPNGTCKCVSGKKPKCAIAKGRKE